MILIYEPKTIDSTSKYLVKIAYRYLTVGKEYELKGGNFSCDNSVCLIIDDVGGEYYFLSCNENFKIKNI